MKQRTLLLIIFIALSCSRSVTPQATGDTEKLQALIGKTATDPDLKKFLNTFQEEAEIATFDDLYYFVYNKNGIDFCFNKGDTLTTIFFFNEGANDHRAYKGELPYNLNFKDTRKVVSKKLGRPSEQGGGETINYWFYYPALGLEVDYYLDSATVIHNISMSKRGR